MADNSPAVPDKTHTGKLTVGAVFDDRLSFDGAKNPLMPITGWLVAGSLSVASTWLAGSHDFLVASAQVQRYQPLGAGVSLIFNLRGDWGIPIGENSLPAVDRFYAGGDVATRGYATDMLKTDILSGPVSPIPGAVGFRIIPAGGNIRFLGTAELQFPITRLAGFPWVGALFFDAGSLFDRPSTFDIHADVKVSVGASLLRLLTPVGPISLEYAYPLTQTQAEQTWRGEPWYRHWPGLIHFNWGIPILR
jgi:outer membrane protein assembly factor BamA